MSRGSASQYPGVDKTGGTRGLVVVASNKVVYEEFVVDPRSLVSSQEETRGLIPQRVPRQKRRGNSTV